MATIISAECSPQADNVLRTDCRVALDVAAPLTFEYSNGANDFRIEFEASDTHSFTLTGLFAETPYSYTALVYGDFASGDFTTQALPSRLPSLVTTGSSTANLLLMAAGNDIIISDTSGNIRWYQEVVEEWDEPQRGTISGYDWTGDGVVLQCSSNLMRYTLDGTEISRFERGVDFDKVLHHDVFWSSGRAFSINAGVHTYPDGDFIVDGFYVFDDTGVIAEWDLHDHLDTDPEATGASQVMWDGVFPGAEDLAHANAVFEAADGTLLISFRLFHAVYAVAGVDDTDFGALMWVLSGQEEGDFHITADPAITTQTDFIGQHQPRLENGILTLFDNRSGTDARTLTFSLDETVGIAEIIETHRLERNCGIQSSAYTLPSGNTLATCSTAIDVVEFPKPGTASDDTPVWTMSITTDAPWVARAIPIANLPVGW